jgi:hypothetical protein
MSQFEAVTTSDDVLRLAMEATGIPQTQSESWRPGLNLMLDELATSTAFSPHGRDYIIDNSVKALARRLKVDDYAEKHPEVLHAPVERPIFILGMPRTGTTVISYLLDRDPARRSLLHWECVDPIPPASSDTLRTDPRCLALIEEQNQLLNALRSAHMSVSHWEDADGPTECMFIHNQDFKGLSWDAFLKTSRYAVWLFDEADMTTTYEYQKRYLQVLQSTAPGTWSLKMPSHSVHIEALLKVFPDARLIWAHRDPYRATGSLANLWKLPKQPTLQPDSIDFADMGQKAQWQMSYHVDRPLRAREHIGDDRFFHMYYSEMMRDPLDVMRRIYAWAGDPLTEDTENRMRAWLAAHPQDHYGTNTYSLEEYSLTVDALQPTFAEYLDTFPIELEATA